MDALVARYYRTYRIDRIIPPSLMPQLTRHAFDKGQQICEVGQPIEALWFLVEGRAKVFMPMENARQLLVCFYQPLQMFGDQELFERAPRAVTGIEALTPCTCLALKRDVILAHLADNPEFLRRLCLSLGRKLGRSNRNSALNMLHPVENRLASYILGTATRDAGQPAEFTGNLSQIADFLGTSFRHLHRSLQGLCARGILAKHGRHYTLVDEAALQQRAAGIFMQPGRLDEDDAEPAAPAR